MLLSTVPFDSTTRTNVTLRMTNSFTNTGTGGNSLGAVTRPTTVADYMLFDGTKAVRYSDTNNTWHVVAPYSVEFECYLESGDGRWIATVGEGYAKGWPEWAIIQSGGSIILTSSSNNNGNTTSQTLVPAYNVKQWYRIGFMFYILNGLYRLRGYVNDIQVFDIQCDQPYDSSNGMVWGADWASEDSNVPAAVARHFVGRIRNVTLGNSLFWTV